MRLLLLSATLLIVLLNSIQYCDSVYGPAYAGAAEVVPFAPLEMKEKVEKQGSVNPNPTVKPNRKKIVEMIGGSLKINNFNPLAKYRQLTSKGQLALGSYLCTYIQQGYSEKAYRINLVPGDRKESYKAKSTAPVVVKRVGKVIVRRKGKETFIGAKQKVAKRRLFEFLKNALNFQPANGTPIEEVCIEVSVLFIVEYVVQQELKNSTEIRKYLKKEHPDDAEALTAFENMHEIIMGSNKKD
ncbi:hypothetical protein Ddc_13231 [Ditylenchus destructor]|nr:hypothetical protein Ddc_13231 [Ditylenchus destructor]